MPNQSINTVDNNNNVGFIIICEKKMTTGNLSTSDTNMSELFSNQKWYRSVGTQWVQWQNPAFLLVMSNKGQVKPHKNAENNTLNDQTIILPI